MSSFEVFEHTADIGLRIESDSLDGLFRDAARGVFALIIENPQEIQPRQQVTIDIESEDIEGLFVDWLRELIYRFETDHWLFCEIHGQVSTDRRRYRAECRGEPADWARHLPDHELKAVTYHRLRVEPTANGWIAEVILDV